MEFDINTVGSVASIISLLVSVFVFREVRNLKSLYLRHLIVPQFLRSIKALIEQANTDLSGKRTEQLKGVFLKIDAILERVEEYSDVKMSNRLADVRSGIKLIQGLSSADIIRSSPEVIRKLDALHVNATGLIKVSKWQGK